MNPIGVMLSVVAGLVAIVAVVGIYNGITARMDEGDAVTLLNTLRANTDQIYAGQASYGTDEDLVPILSSMGRVPDRFMRATNPVTIEHPFDRNVSVVGNGSRYRITFQDLDEAACFAVGQAYADRTRAGSGIINLQIGDDVPAEVYDGDPTVRTLSWVRTQCGSGATLKNVTFVFG